MTLPHSALGSPKSASLSYPLGCSFLRKFNDNNNTTTDDLLDLLIQQDPPGPYPDPAMIKQMSRR